MTERTPLLREPCDSVEYLPNNLTADDLARFRRPGVLEKLMEAAGIERMTNEEARERLAIARERSGDMAGIYFPYRDPCDGRRTSARLRRDHPEVEAGAIRNKYQSEISNGRPHLYFPPNVKAALADKLRPVVFVESEKSALALVEWADRNQRGLLPIATGGCQGWRGKIGKVLTPDGVGADEKGPSPDFALISWPERDVFILFDANVTTNRDVWWARAHLAHYLRELGARVHLPKLPQHEGLNGPDDCIALLGDVVLAEVLGTAALFGESARAETANFIATIETQILPITDEQEKSLYQHLAVIDSRDDRTRFITLASAATKGTLTKKQIASKVSFLRESLLRERAEGWQKELLVSEAGTPKALLSNAVLMLRHASEWQGVLCFNEFSLNTETGRAAPWPQSKPGAVWNDDDDSRTACWLQQHNVAVSSKVAGEAVQVVARENPFHPIKRELEGLVWDQQPRTITWLHDHLGAEDSDLNAVMGAKYLISAVARIYQPGCQADTTLLLEGPQGEGKSTALRILAGDQYFSDHLSDIAGKDARIELLGKWIIEMAEFVSRRSELERKGFLTATADNFRAPYERRARWVPRSCVFAATTNDATPLTDETGGRRYWCVTCGTIDLERLRRNRAQLWANIVREKPGTMTTQIFGNFSQKSRSPAIRAVHSMK